MGKSKASVAFLDGCIIEKDFYFISTRMDAQPDDEYDHGRIKWIDAGLWFHQDRNWQVASVCVMRATDDEPRRGYVALEEGSGVVGIYWPGATAPVDEVLPGAEDGNGIPSLTQVRQIGNNLYVCGYGGKVMRRNEGKWEPFDTGLKAPGLGDYLQDGMPLREALEAANLTQRDIEAIHGFSDDAIFCVGRLGLIFYSEGTSWMSVESPTVANLNCVYCAPDGYVYTAGNPGVLLKGTEKGFSALRTGVDDSFYSMSWFQGHLYVGGLKGLYRLEQDGLHYVDTKQGNFSCVALDSGDGHLLVVAERWLLVFDGVNWKRLDDTDNEGK